MCSDCCCVQVNISELFLKPALNFLHFYMDIVSGCISQKLDDHDLANNSQCGPKPVCVGTGCKDAFIYKIMVIAILTV